MVQINLLPDVKREYLHSQQMKHTFIVGSVLVMIAAVAAVVLLFIFVQVLQPRHQANLQEDIDDSIVAIEEKPDGSKVVTVQGALQTLPGLQDKKLVSTRLFNYVRAFTPTGISYNNVEVDFTTNTMKLGGGAVSYERANALANNIKSAKFTYKQNDSVQTIEPFSGVVFDGLSRNEQAENGMSVSFSLSFQFNPILFAQNISDTSLTVNASSEELLLPTIIPFSEVAPAAPVEPGTLPPGTLPQGAIQ